MRLILTAAVIFSLCGAAQASDQGNSSVNAKDFEQEVQEETAIPLWKDAAKDAAIDFLSAISRLIHDNRNPPSIVPKGAPVDCGGCIRG